MLSFAKSIRIINGHAVFPDSDDDRLFYLAPRMPRIDVDANGVPEFSMTQYLSLGDADTESVWGGFLSLSVVLDVETTVLNQITGILKAELGDDALRVSPLPFQSGEVRLILLGQTQDSVSVDQPVDSQDSPPSVFDIDILGAGKPSLDGQGRTSFQVTLNGKAAAFLEQAMGHSSMPVLVNYSMTLEGLRPAFQVEIEADWSKVYKELQQKFKANVYYVRADLENTVKETMQDAGVKVTTTIESVDATDDAQQAEKALLDWALNTFFAPSHTQGGGTQELVDTIVDGIGGLADSLMPGVSLTLKNLREDEVRTFSAQMNRTMAERRVLTFDATLGQALEVFRIDTDGAEAPGWAALKEKLVLQVDIPDEPRLNVQLSVADRFATDGVRSVLVDVARQDADGAFIDEKQFRFDNAAQTHTYSVSLLTAGRAALGQPYFYRVRAEFDPSSPFGAAEGVQGEWIQSRSNTLRIDSRADTPYALNTLTVLTEPGFPFSQFETVTIECRAPAELGDAVTVPLQQKRITLDKETQTGTWQFRNMGDSRYAYQVTYLKPAGRGDNIITDWVTGVSPLLTLPNPAAAARRVNIINDLPWDRINFASVELKYEDPAHDILLEEQISLSAEERMVQRVYAIADKTAQNLSYRLTALFINGNFLVGDWRETSDSTIIVGANLVEERHIRILSLSPLAQSGLKDIQLDLEALDEHDAAIHTKTLRMTQTENTAQSWSFAAGSPPLKTIRVKARFTQEDGFSTTQGWQKTERDIILVNPSTRSVVVE